MTYSKTDENSYKGYSFNFIIMDNAIGDGTLNVSVNYKGDVTFWDNPVKMYDYFSLFKDLNMNTFVKDMNKAFLEWCEIKQKQTRATELLKIPFAAQALEEMNVMYAFLDKDNEVALLDNILQYNGIIGYAHSILTTVQLLLRYKAR